MKNFHSNKKLGSHFYKRELLTVAKELLGKIFVKSDGMNYLSGKIVEVEAYHGDFDEAAHSYKGLTKRTQIMFECGGYLYVYFTYGIHHCCNIVTGKKGQGTAVLIRGIEPLTGIQKMARNRFGGNNFSKKEIFNLTSGPGKICQAFGIDRSHSGLDLTGDKIYILDSEKIKPNEIGISRRIGISKSVELPWRFFMKNNPYVSRK